MIRIALEEAWGLGGVWILGASDRAIPFKKTTEQIAASMLPV